MRGIVMWMWWMRGIGEIETRESGREIGVEMRDMKGTEIVRENKKDQIEGVGVVYPGLYTNWFGFEDGGDCLLGFGMVKLDALLRLDERNSLGDFTFSLTSINSY